MAKTRRIHFSADRFEKMSNFCSHRADRLPILEENHYHRRRFGNALRTVQMVFSKAFQWASSGLLSQEEFAMKKMCIFLLLLFAAQGVRAQDWAKATLAKSPRHSEWVTVKHDGRSVETFVVYPEAKEKRPVVLIIHEIF